MKHGSLPRWIARLLPAGSLEPNHAPDGLTEADIDALMTEAGIADEPESPDEAEDCQLGKVIPLRPKQEDPNSEFGGDAA